MPQSDNLFKPTHDTRNPLTSKPNLLPLKPTAPLPAPEVELAARSSSRLAPATYAGPALPKYIATQIQVLLVDGAIYLCLHIYVPFTHPGAWQTPGEKIGSSHLQPPSPLPHYLLPLAVNSRPKTLKPISLSPFGTRSPPNQPTNNKKQQNIQRRVLSAAPKIHLLILKTRKQRQEAPATAAARLPARPPAPKPSTDQSRAYDFRGWVRKRRQRGGCQPKTFMIIPKRPKHNETATSP